MPRRGAYGLNPMTKVNVHHINGAPRGRQCTATKRRQSRVKEIKLCCFIELSTTYHTSNQHWENRNPSLGVTFDDIRCKFEVLPTADPLDCNNIERRREDDANDEVDARPSRIPCKGKDSEYDAEESAHDSGELRTTAERGGDREGERCENETEEDVQQDNQCPRGLREDTGTPGDTNNEPCRQVSEGYT